MSEQRPKQWSELVEHLLCVQCGERDFTGTEAGAKCPACGSDDVVGCGPVDVTDLDSIR